MYKGHTALILPKEISSSSVSTAVSLIKSRWSFDDIFVLLTTKTDCDFEELLTYKKLFLDFSYFDSKRKREIETKFDIKINRIVILRDINGLNPEFEWEKEICPVYRDVNCGNADLRVVGKHTGDSFKFYKQHIFVEELKDTYNYFPYGYISSWNNFGDLNGLGFRCEDDFQKYASRDKDTILIAIFGNSAAFDMFAKKEFMFSSLLGGVLSDRTGKKHIVLNFAKPASTVLNSIIDYTIFARDIKPDIVVFYGGYNDIVFGQITDSCLLEKYSITYFYELEKKAAALSGKKYEQSVNYKNSSSSVVKVFYDRVMQFNALCKADNTKFVFALQPHLYSKAAVNIVEEQKYSEAIGRVGYKNIFKKDVVVLLYEKLKLVLDDCDIAYLDLDKKFAAFDDKTFDFHDHVHQASSVNQYIASCLAEFIMEV